MRCTDYIVYEGSTGDIVDCKSCGSMHQLARLVLPHVKETNFSKFWKSKYAWMYEDYSFIKKYPVVKGD